MKPSLDYGGYRHACQSCSTRCCPQALRAPPAGTAGAHKLLLFISLVYECPIHAIHVSRVATNPPPGVMMRRKCQGFFSRQKYLSCARRRPRHGNLVVSPSSLYSQWWRNLTAGHVNNTGFRRHLGCPAASCELSNLDLWWMLSWLCVGDVSAIHKDGVSHMVLLPSSQGVSSFIEGCWEEKECLTPNLNVLFDLLIPKLVLLLTIRRLAVWYLSVEAVVREKVLPRSRSMPPCGPNGFSRTPRWSGTHH